MQKIISNLWKIRRDIVSDGIDQALRYISEIIPFRIIEVPSGTECWTWTVPELWRIRNGWIRSGSRSYLELSDHPLHVMSYSQPIKKEVTIEELLAHVHTSEMRPDAIPFEQSYYKKKWGFCLEHRKLSAFSESVYEVCIESETISDSLKIGELFIPGLSRDEIAFVAHICHPHMANDNLSGVAVLVDLARRLIDGPSLKYGFRFLLVPETIGSIAYLAKNEDMIERIKYAIVVDSVGHDDILSLQHSVQGETELDAAADYVLRTGGFAYRSGMANEVMGSDEKVFNGPGVNVPSINLSRSGFWRNGEWPYPEWHSSDDVPEIIINENLVEARKVLESILEIMCSNWTPKRCFKGPLFLSRFGLWVDWKKEKKLSLYLDDIMQSLEGNKTVLDIARDFDLSYSTLHAWLEKMHAQDLIKKH